MAALLKEYLGTSYLFGGNAPFIEELYEAYLDDPASVPPEWRRYFDQLQQLPGAPRRGARADPRSPSSSWPKAPRRQRCTRRPRSGGGRSASRSAVLQLDQRLSLPGRAARQRRSAQALREARASRSSIPRYYGLTEADMDAVFNTGSLVGPEQMPLREILRALRETYCGSIGVEYMYITDPAQKRWIQQRLESARARSRATRRTYKRHHPRAPDRGRDAGEVSAHALRRTEALFPRGRRQPHSAARLPAAACRRARASRRR